MPKLLTRIFFFTIAAGLGLSAAEKDTARDYGYGIVLLPSAEIIAQAAELNSRIAAALPDLANPGNHPHVTLYHLVCEQVSLVEIFNELGQLHVRPFNLNFTGIYSTADRWIDWGMVKGDANTQTVHALHAEVLKIAAKHRTALLPRAADLYDTLEEAKKAQVDEFGVSGVLQFYNPHTSLFYYEFDVNGLIGDARLGGIAADFAAEGTYGMSCPANQIAIGKLGYNGNITEIMYSSPINFV